ncbi:hypothetical protein CLHOM_12270 [Clostridium homopropionicum DSM 5847]|uniref:DUF3169 family protein n=1 Tax=Clostridium homopropionicum DSM 5847 TaxID=1121318 RepID=A0A0L6ZC84_9CLOT|nr:DUF3169 family protein [Clostridium homopropionicum]KOA20408.1 hypothetical protein CLHOM_12270 [Clostridium homopropionicum DSM 5847]SFG75445.1 Protein of unknown function [Clostridium homopropionicum]
MRKYKNFIITITLAGLFGGFIGYLTKKEFSINLVRSMDNLYYYLFMTFFLISVVIGIISAIIMVILRAKYKEIDIEELPKHIERKIDMTISLSTIIVIISMVWVAVMVNKSVFEIKVNYVLVSAASSIISSILQVLSIRVYNRYYPDRKLNMFENNSDKKFFERLDEGEKWIAYSSSYRTFKGMKIVYSISMVVSIFLSTFLTIPIILPIFIGAMWIIQTVIYTMSARKYDS